MSLATLFFRIKLVMAMSVKTLPRGDGKTKLVCLARALRLSKTATAAAESGTRCDCLIFMRLAESVQMPLSKSTSSQTAWRASPERAAVSKTNLMMSRVTSLLLRRTLVTKSGTSRHGTAGWCSTVTALLGCLGNSVSTMSTTLRVTSSRPQHHFMTAWQRCLTRPAVSTLTNQIGCNT